MKGIKNHNQTNRLIKWTVIAFDFVALWLLLPVVTDFIPDAEEWTDDKHRLFWGICTMSMVLAEYWFYSTIHQRMGAGDRLPWRDPRVVADGRPRGARHLVYPALELMARPAHHLDDGKTCV